MPWAPKRHRAIPQTAKTHQAYELRRGSARQRGYDRAWEKCAAMYGSEHPLCEDCLERGMVVEKDVIDHIVPLSQGGARLDFANLRSLCWSCHEKKKARERRG